MANLSLTRVNQKLMQAKQLLQNVDADSITQVHCNALLEGAAFHLICAYQHYLREIAETYSLKNILGLRSEVELIAAFESVQKYPSEAEELKVLRGNSTSWLAQLYSYYDSLWRLPVITQSAESENLISLVSLDESNLPSVNLTLMQDWLAEFRALVVRQRETSAEF